MWKFKHTIYYENVLNLKDVERRKNIAKLRTSAHKLRIETDRFNNKNKYLPTELRLRLNCKGKQIEDKFHFIIECDRYKSLRNELFQKCIKYNKYFEQYHKYDKFIWIMSCENLGQFNSLGEFITLALKLRNK